MLETHPAFGELPACSACERRAWTALFTAADDVRRIGVFRCSACGELGTVHDATATEATEFRNAFDV